MNAPPNSGSQYYNYKNQFSIVLLGMVDSNYKFIYFNVGAYGSESDGGIFKDSELGQKLRDGALELPNAESVYGSDFAVPYCILGDAAFPLTSYLTVPYGGRNLSEDQQFFNKEHAKGRVQVEDSFGILSARWRVFLKRMTLIPKNADKVICACVLLHNFILSFSDNNYVPEQFVDRYMDNGDVISGNWRAEAQNSTLQPLPTNARVRGARNATQNAIEMRNKVKTLIYSRHISQND